VAVEAFPADVAVAIVSHDNGDKLLAALASLDAAGCPPQAIRVLDVASGDRTAERVRERFPAVAVHTLARNDGPNPARNLALRECPLPLLFLMDGDVRVRPDTVQALRRAMRDAPDVKIGSPIVVPAAAPQTIQYAGTTLHFVCEAINPWKDRPLEARGCDPRDIGVAAASGLLIDRQAAIESGLFDERYFLGKDDGDFTHRMRIAGHRILEVPAAIVVHDSGPRGDWLFYYQIRNRWHFMLKNFQARTLLLLMPTLVLHELLQAAVLHARGYAVVYWKAVGGLLAMVPALPRDRAFIARIRRLPDGRLLHADPLVLRDDVARGGLARAGKDAYDAWLSGYWRLVRPLLGA
jgi:GT2 family glycosyltransferase